MKVPNGYSGLVPEEEYDRVKKENEFLREENEKLRSEMQEYFESLYYQMKRGAQQCKQER
jgi:hypothetical protein